MIPEPVQGKTYSLLDENGRTESFYQMIKKLADKYIVDYNSLADFLDHIQSISKNKRKLKHYLKTSNPDSKNSELLKKLHQVFQYHTRFIKKHLKSLPFWKFRDRRLATNEPQYHLYMLEVELFNRLNKSKFQQSDYKIALLPHCLRDLSKNCKADKEGFDVVCMSCSKNCFINEASNILKEYDIHPYIWMRADFKKLGKQLKLENKSLGILGIACIPELMAGLRKCQKYGIPAIGIPLNANCCPRWFGEFFPTSINTDQLKNLLMN